MLQWSMIWLKFRVRSKNIKVLMLRGCKTSWEYKTFMAMKANTVVDR